MRELPGRKSIILFSDGLTICTLDSSDADPERCTKMFDALKQLTALANRSSVTIYSLDSKGLADTGPTAGDAIGANPTALMSAVNSRSQQNFEQQEGLTYLAKETGGRAFLNTNDFSGSVAKALEDQTGFYLVAYQPDSESFDPKTRRFNKLEVKVKRPGVFVRYRSGFFGVEDKDIRPVAQTTQQQMFSALSSPFAANGIGLKLNTLFGADKQKAPFIQSFLHIDAKDLKFTDEPNGEKKTVIDIMAMSFGENGVPVDQLGRTYTLSIKKEVYEKILKEGVVYNFAFPIKLAGAYQMRIAVRDTVTSKIGSANQFIEVPDLKKGKLTLSGIVLQNLTLEQWKNSGVKLIKPPTENDQKSNPMADTSLRSFKSGTILRYAIDIYNAKLDKSKNPNLQTQVRVFRDSKIVLDRQPTPLKTDGQADSQLLHFGGALAIGKEFPKGDYVLQLIVIDALAKKKSKVATQWIQFEIVD